MPTILDYPAPSLPLTGSEVLIGVQNPAGNKPTNADPTVSFSLFNAIAKYKVADLPTPTEGQGSVAYALDGRNTGEGAGAGTGCLVTYNSAGVWAAVWSGVAVTA